LFCLGDFMAAFSLLIGRIANDRNHIIWISIVQLTYYKMSNVHITHCSSFLAL
jgi:hypothetical protein